MIAKKYRFHSRGGIKYTYKNGVNIRGQQISLVYAINTRKHQRFAVVISKKVLKSAVGRNRIRRRIYEVIRLELPKFTKNLDCIFIVHRADIANVSHRELQKIVKELLYQTK